MRIDTTPTESPLETALNQSAESGVTAPAPSPWNIRDHWRTAAPIEVASNITRRAGEIVADASRGLCFTSIYLTPPDVAISAISEAVIESIGAGEMARNDFSRILDACLHTGEAGYVEGYNTLACKGAHIKRVPDDQIRASYARYDIARAKDSGAPIALIDDTLAQYVPNTNDDDEGPYRELMRTDLEKAARAWKPGATRSWVNGYIEALRSLAPRYQTAEEIGLDEVRIRNGVLNRSTFHVRPYTVNDHFIAKFSGIEFPVNKEGQVLQMTEPVIELPDKSVWKFSEWLMEIMPDINGRAALLDATACLLMPQLDVQRAFVLFGIGRNGKGTWVRLLQTMVGPSASHLVSHLSVEDFADEKKIPHIQGKIMNLSDESNPKGFLGDTAKIKAVATHDIVGGRPPYGQWREWRPVIGLLFCLNAPINSAEHSDALYERFVFITFPEAFFRKENPAIKNDYMTRREVASYAAYLALVCRPRFYDASAFSSNPYVLKANAEHRDEADPIARAWQGVRDDLEYMEAVPLQLVFQIMRQWKKRFEPNGRMPGYTSREFRSSLKTAAGKDGWLVVPDQLPVCNWINYDDRRRLVTEYADKHKGYETTYSPTDLANWIDDYPFRTRSWLVRRGTWEIYQETGTTPVNF